MIYLVTVVAAVDTHQPYAAVVLMLESASSRRSIVPLQDAMFRLPLVDRTAVPQLRQLATGRRRRRRRQLVTVRQCRRSAAADMVDAAGTVHVISRRHDTGSGRNDVAV